MKQTPIDSKLSPKLWHNVKVDYTTAMGVRLAALPEGWEEVKGKAIKIKN
jgi:hypothetical protein